MKTYALWAVILLAPPSLLEMALSNARRARAQMDAVEILEGFKVGREIRVEVENTMPSLDILAHTTKGPSGECVIHVLPEEAPHRWVLAHEVCHCVKDYEAMGEKGWMRDVGRRERDLRELRAKQCTDEVVKSWVVAKTLEDWRDLRREKENGDR